MTKTKILSMLVSFALLGAAPVHAQEITGEASAGVGAEGTANVAKESGVSFAQAASCTMHIGGFVAGNAVAISKLRKAGGVVKVAKKILTAEGRLGKMKAVAAVFGEAIGIETVVGKCS